MPTSPPTESLSDATRAADRVPLKTKISYGLGTACDMWGHWLYPGLTNAVFNVHLGLSPTLVGTANSLIRFFDAASDPFFGWRSDNTRTRFGRRRPYILVGSILGGLCLPLLFCVPGSWIGATFLNVPALFWWMLLTNLFFVPIMSSFNMPYQSLGAELTPDYNERTGVMSVKNAMQKIFEVGFYLGLPFTNLAWFTLANGKQDVLTGVQVYCAILGVLMAIFGLLIFLNVRERYYESAASRQGKVSLFASFGETIRCRPFRILLITSLFFQLGTSMVQSLGYYCTLYYVANGNTVSGNNWNGLMGFSFMAGGFLGAPFFGWVGKRFDKRQAVMLVGITGICAYGGSWFTYNPSLPWLQLLASGSMAFASAGFWVMNGSMGADTMDYDELTTGKRREGSFSACSSWIMKAANALGILASGVILDSTGFLASKGTQAAETLFSMRLALAVIPIAGIGLALLTIWTYPLTKRRMLEIRQQLEARRGTV
jgi:glycoside/pentoside/hexuronide:cation symporter, GPH family